MYRIFLSLGCCSFVFALQITATAYASDDAPGWLQQAVSVKPAAYDKDVKAVVLLNESNVSFDGGKLVTTERYAARILSREGRKEAVAIESYLSNFSEVRDMQAWLIAPNGTVTDYGKKDSIDQVADPDDVYNEVRLKIIDGSYGADVGYVFGYTLVKEDHP